MRLTLAAALLCVLTASAAARSPVDLAREQERFKLLREQDAAWADQGMLLAKLYLARAGSAERRAVDLLVVIDADPSPAVKNKRLQEVMLLRKQAQLDRKTLMLMLVRITKSAHHRNYARMDLVLHTLAQALIVDKRMPDAFGTYKRLIKDYPRSIHVPDAYLAFAEHYFEQHDMKGALPFYDKVTQFDGPLRPYAHFKRGWAYFNLQSGPEALAAFMKAASDPRVSPTLRRSALMDSTRAYASFGAAAKALAFYQKVAPAELAETLGWLADHYQDQGQTADETTIRAALAKLVPEPVPVQ